MPGLRCCGETGWRSSRQPSGFTPRRHPSDCGCIHARRGGKIDPLGTLDQRSFPMPVFYEKRNHVGWLTLSRPEARNAWGDDFNREITKRCDEMASDREIRLA